SGVPALKAASRAVAGERRAAGIAVIGGLERVAARHVVALADPWRRRRGVRLRENAADDEARRDGAGQEELRLAARETLELRHHVLPALIANPRREAVDLHRRLIGVLRRRWLGVALQCRSGLAQCLGEPVDRGRHALLLFLDK